MKPYSVYGVRRIFSGGVDKRLTRILLVPYLDQPQPLGLSHSTSLSRTISSGGVGWRSWSGCGHHSCFKRFPLGDNLCNCTFTRCLNSGSKFDASTRSYASDSCSKFNGHTRYLRSDSSSGNDNGTDMEVVYVAPLKGAVRALKVFSLTTATAALLGSPVLVWIGNPSVPLVARITMTFVVMFAGLGTTGLLHWMLKGYVMRMEYSKHSGKLAVHTLSVLAKLKKFEFHVSESEPPSKAIAFSTFQAKGKPFFLHTEVFKDRELLSKLLGAYSIFEDRSIGGQSESKDL